MRLAVDKAGAEQLREAVKAFCSRAEWNKIATGRLAIATDEIFGYIAREVRPGRAIHLVLRRNDQFAEAEFVGPNLPRNLLNDPSARETLKTAKGLALHVLRHRLAQIRKALREADELVEFLLLLSCPVFGVIEILPPARSVDAGRLQLRCASWRDPDVLPCGRDRERPDALELRLVPDRAPA